MPHFQVTVYEIPNPYIKRTSYKETYEIMADSAVEATQEALNRFGDWSQVKDGGCVEFDPDYPPGSHFLESADYQDSDE